MVVHTVLVVLLPIVTVSAQLLHDERGDFVKSEPLRDEWWEWKCEKKRCKRHPVGSEFIAFRLTLHMCRLTCGAAGALWPKPTGRTELNSTLLPFHPKRVHLNATCNRGGDVVKFLKEVTKLFSRTLSFECQVTTSSPNQDKSATLLLDICVVDPGTSLFSSINESYELSVSETRDSTRAMVKAKTVFGARHALETLSQLTACSNKIGDIDAPMVIVAEAHITDEPVYQHRGLLVDTGKNWLSEEALRRTIDAMAATKMNVLHWYVSDSASFPLRLNRVPQMAKYGSFYSTQTYTGESIKQLSEYAKFRGVRILVEISAPHYCDEGWQWGPENDFGELVLCRSGEYREKHCKYPPCGQLNPDNPNIFRVLKDIYRDILDNLSLSDQMHLGLKSGTLSCWNYSLSNMTMSMSDYAQKLSEFHKLQLNAFDEALKQVKEKKLYLQKVIVNNEPNIIIWESLITSPEHIEKYIDKKRHIIQTLGDQKNENPERLLVSGYNIIVTYEDAWFLNSGFEKETGYSSWKKVYDVKIPVKGEETRVLGGEVVLWGEFVDDQVLDRRLWPRAAAAAERLWSYSEKGRSGDTLIRLVEHRDRLIRRGVPALTVQTGYCAMFDGECDGYEF